MFLLNFTLCRESNGIYLARLMLLLKDLLAELAKIEDALNS
ncbi:TPA: hypothetical protein ACFNPQ_001148 [Neisseria meningitidis]